MKKKLLAAVLALLLCASAAYVTHRVETARSASRLETLAQGKLSSAIGEFSACLEQEDDLAYWRGVSDFREYVDLVYLRQEDDAQSTALYGGLYSAGCAVHAVLVSQPENVKPWLEDIVGWLEKLEEDPSAETARAYLTELNNSLENIRGSQKNTD